MLHNIPLNDPYVISMFPPGKAPKKMPGLMIFETCKPVIEDMRDIQADEKNPNDCAKQPHDVTHSVDMVRYFCVSRVTPAEQKQEEIELYDEDDKNEDMEAYMCGGEITEEYMNFSA
jgi:phage terminase large subunit